MKILHRWLRRRRDSVVLITLRRRLMAAIKSHENALVSMTDTPTVWRLKAYRDVLETLDGLHK